MVDCQHLIYGIHIGKYDRQETHGIVSVIGIFKGGNGDPMHLIPLINLTKSVISILVWLDRFMDLLKSERRTNYPEFCDEEGTCSWKAHLKVYSAPFWRR